MNRNLLFATAAAGIMACASSQAFASADDYISKFCATGCANPGIERSAIKSTWDALSISGTSAFLGGSIDSVRLTPATMIAGARMVGVPAFDALLRTGKVPFAGGDARRATMTRMASVQNVDVNTTVGLPAQREASATGTATDPSSTASPASAVAGLGALAAIFSPAGGDMPGAQSSNGCDAQVERMQIASAANFVQEKTTLATSSAGFTRKDGQGAQQSYNNEIGNGGRPMSTGFSGMNCLGNLFNFSNLDILFKPPLMNNMMTQLGGMKCGPALNGIGAIGQMLPSNIFQTSGMGGFLPGMNLSQYIGGLNGAATGNFTGIANMAMSLGGGSSSSGAASQTASIGSLYGAGK